MKATGNWTLPVVLLCFIGTVTALLYERNEWTQERGTWDRERDSLTTANNLLSIRLDSARAESIAHEARAESLATVPRTIYITNAQSLTRNASVDSLWLMLLTDPFIAVPETLVHHGQP